MAFHIFIPLINKLADLRSKIRRENISYSACKKVGIIASYGSPARQEYISEFSTKLKNDGKKYFTLIESAGSGETTKNVFSRNDLSMLGKWKNSDVLKFCELDFDYLICLEDKTRPQIENILIKSRAKCRIGIYNPLRKGLFEMMIKPSSNGNYEDQIDEVYKYLKLL